MIEVWRYSVSHRQLLLRSNREGRWPTRIELLFKVVEFMAVPPIFMDGVTISQCHPTGEDLPDFLRSLRLEEPWYRLVGTGSIGYVAAGGFFSHVDELEYSDPSGLMRPPFV